MAYARIEFSEAEEPRALVYCYRGGEPGGDNGKAARLTRFILATFPRRAEEGSPGAHRLAAMFVAWEAAHAGRDPLECDHLGISLDSVRLAGCGFLYQVSCGRRGDHSGLPSVAVQPLSTSATTVNSSR